MQTQLDLLGAQVAEQLGSGIKVIGTREIIMNKGARAGIKKGMPSRFSNLRAADVTDPDTNENLGSLYLEKARVGVMRVEERLALARTY